MTRLLLALVAAAALAAIATSGPAQAITFHKAKNGTTITCTWQDCVDYCKQVGGRVALCPAYCTKTIPQRKASGDCK